MLSAGTAPTNFFRETPEKNGFSARALPVGVATFTPINNFINQKVSFLTFGEELSSILGVLYGLPI